jgi:hypothetical protein
MRLVFSGLAVRWAALEVIGVASGRQRLLLVSAESEGSPAIGTLEKLILNTNWMTSLG